MNMYRTVTLAPYKQEIDPRNLVVCWKECLERSDYYNGRKTTQEFNKQNYWKKKGIALNPMMFTAGYNSTYYHQAAALVNIYLDGSVLVLCGGAELGQGLYTKVLQMLLQKLKCPPYCPWGLNSFPRGESRIKNSRSGIDSGIVHNMAVPNFKLQHHCLSEEVPRSDNPANW